MTNVLVHIANASVWISNFTGRLHVRRNQIFAGPRTRDIKTDAATQRFEGPKRALAAGKPVCKTCVENHNWPCEHCMKNTFGQCEASVNNHIGRAKDT